MPEIFEELNAEFGPFTIDGAADHAGRNAFCPVFSSSYNSFLDQPLSGHMVYCNPPFDQIEAFLTHILGEQHGPMPPMALFVLPDWTSAAWWPLLQQSFRAVRHFPAGRFLFTIPRTESASAREYAGPTRWGVTVWSLLPMVENLHGLRQRASGRSLPERVPPRAAGFDPAGNSIGCKDSAAGIRSRDGHPDATTAAGPGKSRATREA